MVCNSFACTPEAHQIFLWGERIKSSKSSESFLLWEQINHLEKESHLRILLSEDPQECGECQLTTLNLCSGE